MVTRLSDPKGAVAPRTPVGRIGKFMTRVLLFVFFMGALLSAATMYSLPLWVTLLIGAGLVVPMLYWPTLGIAVLLAYLALAGIRALA